ncbi:MAG: hypothetical protein AAFO07_16210 [Bacteroidota bacterium]
MKKIGILFGKERSFPEAFVERINSKGVEGIHAEFVSIGKVAQADPTDYAVIVDRISQDVPFYRAFLKNAALCGTAVINNPFWWSADEKFFNNALAVKVGVPVPNTVLLPSNVHPDDTSSESFANLAYPLYWEEMFEYIGFPAFMKPFAGGGWKNVYKLDSKGEFFEKYHETGQLVMMLQEAIDFTAYFRCYCIGRKHVKIMHYEPRNPHHLRYVANHDVSQELLDTIHDYTIKLNEALGYDFNTVEFAIRDGVPYAIDFCNPAPDAERTSVGEENFEWVVETAAQYAIERALANEEGKDNLTWGTFMKDAVNAHMNGSAKAEKKAKAAVVEAPAVKETTADDVYAKLGAATADMKNDLKKIGGIGPKLEKLLNARGVFTYEQVSKISSSDIDAYKADLSKDFKGKMSIDKWAKEAKALM